jgi:acetolactate synthase-1/2/3 large subunit
MAAEGNGGPDVNGAESLIHTLVSAGVTTCFMNPGTSEIHFVAALDSVRGMRGVPCLFEGVAAGAADGYARMTGNPASTLFHLGPGLSNALANLHNACRARVPMVNIVGDHATYHLRYDAPLASDIAAIARPTSKWFRSSASAADVGRDAAEAVAASHASPYGIATLVLPADTAWGDSGVIAAPIPLAAPPLPSSAQVDKAAALLRNGKPTAILLGHPLTQGNSLDVAARIAAATGARLLAPFGFTRIARGAGRPAVERIAYVVDQALEQLRPFGQLILVGAPAPVAFFAYPGKPSVLTPEHCTIHTLAGPEEDGTGALAALAEALGAARTAPTLVAAEQPALPGGPITLAGLASAVGALLPEGAIVVDESLTSGRGMMGACRGAPPHDWLVNTGGSIGIGLPMAVGAAVACPDRPVLCLQADGSGLYTVQALWTAAREGLAITTVIFANRAYAILKGELAAATANPGPCALDMLDIGRPDIDWVGLAKSLGMAATRVSSLDEFARRLRHGFESRAPNLIEVPL